MTFYKIYSNTINDIASVSDCFGTGFNLHGPTATPSDQIQTPSATVGGPPGRGPSPGPIPKVRRRARMQYTPQQLMVLEDAFAKNPYPTREGRQILEAMTGLIVERIKVNACSATWKWHGNAVLITCPLCEGIPSVTGG